MIDPKHFTQYDNVNKSTFKSVNSDTIISFPEYTDYINSKWVKTHEVKWSKDCENIAIQMVRGDLPITDGTRQVEINTAAEPNGTQQAIDSFVNSMIGFVDFNEFAIVRITFTDKWNNSCYKWVCVCK
jgi:hypothetical protein